MTAQDRCRALLATCRPRWRDGHGADAWAALAEAEVLADDDDVLAVEVGAMRAGLHLLAEQPAEAEACARATIADGERLLGDGAGEADDRPGTEAHDVDPAVRIAVADARVTLASVTGPAGLAALEAIASDPTLVGTGPAARAVNNLLILRLDALRDVLHTTDGRVEAWVRVSEARAALRGSAEQGAVLRQAVDLGMDGAQWERAWSSAQEQIAGEAERNELIAVLAKAALLAWHRGDRAQGRELGVRARSLSVAVDHPWVRTYAYLGGVVAAASGAGDVGAALAAYARCTTAAGHATRPRRVWGAGWVALESGHPPDDVVAFLATTLPGDLDGAADDQRAVLLADARGDDVDPVVARRALEGTTDLPGRARLHLAVARTLRRQGRPTAAALELARARTLLTEWPGWLLNRVEQEAELVEAPVRATPAQRRVLDLLAEGLSNEQVAEALGLSARTVAVHVAALLRANDVGSRTALAARHLRASLTTRG